MVNKSCAYSSTLLLDMSKYKCLEREMLAAFLKQVWNSQAYSELKRALEDR